MKYVIPPSERTAALICSILGFVVISLVAIRYFQEGLRFATSFVLTTPIFYVGFLCWCFWISRLFKFGSYNYAFIGWWLSTIWHSFIVIAAVVSLAGFFLAALDPLGTTLTLVVAAASASVTMNFMIDREKQRAA